jgi:hypothetical protein
MKRQSRSAPLGLRLTPPVKIALQRAATDDQRSLASYVERLLIGHLKAKGYLSVEQPRTDRIAQGAADAKAMAHSAIDEALQHSTASASVRRDRRRALTEMPARAVVKDRRRK